MSFAFFQLINLLVLCLFSLVFILDKYKFDYKVLNNPNEIAYLEIKLTRYRNNVKLCCIRTFAFLSVLGLVLNKMPLENVLSSSAIELILTGVKYAFLLGFISLFILRTVLFFSGLNKADELSNLLFKRFPHGNLSEQAASDYNYVRRQIFAENASMFMSLFCLFSAIGLHF